MNKEKKRKYSKSVNKWIVVSAILGLVPLAGALVVAILNGAMQMTLAQNLANYFCWISLVTALVSIVAIFKLPKWLKLLPIASLLVSLSMFVIFRIAFWIGGASF